MMVSLESKGHFGRLYDIDVEDKNGSCSREDLELPERKCFLCEKEAKVCARSREHTVNEMLLWVEKLIDDYKTKEEKNGK